MARYTQDSIERLREAVDMVALVSRTTELRRVGRQWMGLCPFHEDRSPSFSVDPERGLYHCFACEKGGDAIRFVCEVESLGFPEAVEQLARDSGVELEHEREDPREEDRRRRRERLLALLDRAAGFYAKFLWESEEARAAREYLGRRGLSEEVLRAFRVGYAPAAWDRLLTGARRDGFAPEELAAVDLARRGRSGDLYDRFRERITFPLADARGRVLGFGARAMRGDQQPKYLNTAEGELYHKGRQLFGIDRARSAIARTGRAVVVEGYTDVLALHQAGVEETVAIMGTAFTREQLAELARTAGDEGRVELALDADRSGRDAMLRAARTAVERGVELRVVEMPEGSDPAELVAEGGADAIRQRLGQSRSVLEFEVGRVLADADLDTPEGRDRALRLARELIDQAPERSPRRDHLVRLVADRLDVPTDYVVVAGPAPSRAGVRSRDPAPPSVHDPGEVASRAERSFLARCLGAGGRGRETLAHTTTEHFSSAVNRRARDHLLMHFDDPLEGLSRDDAELAALVAEVALQADGQARAGGEQLRMDFLPLELRRLEREIRRAGRDGDVGRFDELGAAKQRVRREMDAVMGQAR